MASDNFTVQVGNLTDDPELRFTQNGTPVTNFRLAVNQRIKDADGTWRDGETNFFRVNAWPDEAAPSLRWAIAKPERAERSRNGERSSERGQFNDPPPF